MDYEFKTIVLKDDQCLCFDLGYPSDKSSIVKNPHDIKNEILEFFRENKIWIHNQDLMFLNVFWEEGSYLFIAHTTDLKYIILTEDEIMIKDIIE